MTDEPTMSWPSCQDDRSDLNRADAWDQSDLLRFLSSSCQSIAQACDRSSLWHEISCAVQKITGQSCRIDFTSLSRSENSFPIYNKNKEISGILVVECKELSSAVKNAIEILSAQAGVTLSHLDIQENCIKEIAERQVAEFEARHLMVSFEKRLEEAIGEKSVWADVFRGSQYSVCVVSDELRFMSFNPSFERWFERHGGTAPFQGQLIAEALALHPELAAATEKLWRRALSGDDFTHSWSLSSKGKIFHYEARYAPLLDADGKVAGAVHFLLDVTTRIAERERLELVEAALKQSQKMEAVGKLTGGIAHDFNNILTGIVGALDLIGRKISDGNLAAVPRYIEMASASADRAASLTHRLLAFSRKQPVDPRITDVDALILGMGEMISRTVGPEIKVETSTDISSMRVLCDPSQLESAIMNLVVNSREAMTQGGRLLIASNHVEYKDLPVQVDLQPGSYIRISVSDTGIGMSPETVTQAVEPFFTTKGIGHGTGLGLSMVYGFAKQSGGFFDIQSTEGEGTTAAIYLPATSAPVMDDEIKANERCDCRDATILSVEDEPAVRALVVEIVEELGCKVIQAEDGGEGARLLSSNLHIDMLVTDIGLPILNGRQVASVARTSRPDMPILFMTGYSDNATITEGFGERTGLVTKPFRPGQIADAIKRMLS